VAVPIWSPRLGRQRLPFEGHLSISVIGTIAADWADLCRDPREQIDW
jgi:hypothetical protein